MNKQHLFKTMVVAVGLLASSTLFGQATVLGNFGGPTDYLGWDSNTGLPLRVMNNGNHMIQWYTDSLYRMRLTETLTGQTMNGYPGLNLSGHLGVGRFNAPVTTPLAMLHLDSAGSQVTGYRPWMGTGTLMTKMSDMMYVGMLGLSDDRNDAIIGWSDNAGGNPNQGPDRLRFIFTQRVFDPPNSTGQTYYGLEMARMVPDNTGDEGFLGVGDWATAGLEPVERLDILDGRVRIRQLPTDPEADSLITQFVVVDPTGVLHWRDGSGLVPQDQAWLTTGNNGIVAGTHFLGTTNNAPLDIRTDSIHRVRLLPNATYGIGTYASQAKSGSLLLSPNVEQFYNEGGPGPYSLLHLADSANNAQQLGYRPWMRNGITLTGNDDEMYVGQLYRAEDMTDAVICWSDNPGSFLADRFTLRFTSAPDPLATQGSATEQGLQTLLIQPDEDGEQAYVGIGDFDAASETPNERLDVLDGRVRIRELPEASGEATGTYKVMVVDDATAPSGERGVVKWVDPNDLPGGADCDWTINTGANRITTAWQTVGSNGNCPEADWHLGIGAGGSLPGKLTVVETAAKPSAAEHAIHVTMNADDETNYGLSLIVQNGSQALSNVTEGINVSVEDATTRVVGVFAEARLGSGVQSTGRLAALEGSTIHSGSIPFVFGSRTRVSLLSGSTVDQTFGSYNYINHAASVEPSTEVVGVFGAISSNSTGARRGVWGKIYGSSQGDDYAGYFEGDGYLSANMWQTSDAALKVGVESLEDCLGTIGVLSPKQYQFDTESFPGLGLPEGVQAGIMAQDLEGVLPHLVRTVTHVAEYDSTGVLISAPGSYKAVNYIGLIPFLVGAVKEQQGQLSIAADHEAELEARLSTQEARADELTARLDQLEQALAQCCSRIDPSESPLAPEEDLKIDLGGDRLLRIDPNPFTDRTTIRYTLERGGRTMLLVNSSDGKQLQVLSEAVQQAGEYQQEWHTSHLAPGIYYVTLLLDGEPLVKRAVKVN